MSPGRHLSGHSPLSVGAEGADWLRLKQGQEDFVAEGHRAQRGDQILLRLRARPVRLIDRRGG